eukprot:4227797-Alexandrium_andersonii.AAC.1
MRNASKQSLKESRPTSPLLESPAHPEVLGCACVRGLACTLGVHAIARPTPPIALSIACWPTPHGSPRSEHVDGHLGGWSK